MRLENPYHEGELLVQERLGERTEGRRNGRAIADSILKGALKYVEQQSLAVAGTVDDEENIWASVLVGEPGFLRAPDVSSIEVDLTRIESNPEDPLWTNIRYDSRVGLLVIDLGTRRRLRINGRITRSTPEQLRLDVDESYPNCPKYIQRRHLAVAGASGLEAASESRRGRRLGSDQRRLIGSADTFFVASAHPDRGVDASHRGGPPGFVRILDDARIRVPDYTGNRMFNTLGNFAVNPRAGLVLLDFERSRELQLIGRAEIQWDLDDPANETGGTGRFWTSRSNDGSRHPSPTGSSGSSSITLPRTSSSAPDAGRTHGIRGKMTEKRASRGKEVVAITKGGVHPSTRRGRWLLRHPSRIDELSTGDFSFRTTTTQET